jgi:glycerophosphoryl diester phosphodiesterase
MKKLFLFAAFTFSMLSSTLYAQPQIVAHRGYWRLDGSAQNSLTSLQRAADWGLYGSEFDVWITSDGVPVVFHDGVWDGLRIEDTPYPVLMNKRLGNGEFLPTLQQYLQLGKKLPYIKLVLEIKTHKSDERNLQAVKTCLELSRMLGLEKRVEYIAFSRFVCEQLHALSPDSKVAYLNGDLSPAEIKKIGLTGIDYHFNVFKNKPEWLQQAKKLGLEVNVWTVDGEPGLKEFLAMKGIDLITTNDPNILKALLEQ